MVKHTKIVATIGPASGKSNVLEAMIKEGMNVARLNFSHGDFHWHKEIIKKIRDVSRKLKTPVGIMADLQGPRIRIANKNEVKIKKGEEILVASFNKAEARKSKKSKKKVIFLDLKKITEMVNLNGEILIEDGLIKIKVIGKSGNYLKCKVVDEGIIKPEKGVNIPGTSAKVGALTQKDKEVLEFSLGQNVDFIAMSFVRNAKEIKDLRKIIIRKLKKKSELPQIIAKIERKEAINNFDEILRTTDAVMVARGDLGIEMPQADLPIMQKEIITKCLRAAKPVIVATQMLDSMIRNPRPTRAEVSDVSNAVIDHADAVMLSGESASGKYPIESVKTMREIIEKTEESPFDDLEHGFLGDQKSSVSAAIAQSAHELLKDSRAKAIVVASVSGFTARMIARHRPDKTIIVITNSKKTYNQLTLVWGVAGFILLDCRTLDELIVKSVETLKKNKMIKKGDRIVIVAGRPHIKKEHMSLVKIEEIK
jgi:pyruvate kinase